MIYQCDRTATVISRNYNTMAQISYIKCQEVLNEYPQFQNLLKINITEYND